MTGLVIAEAVAIGLLALLVAGLLRSHAEILRALHELRGDPAATLHLHDPQQSAAATNITETMNTIQSITAQTSQGANQTAQSIGNLAQLAANLRRSVADFKLPA